MANELRRSTLSSHMQSIPAHYYNITDAEAWPVAGLLVLVDSNERPVRSELHVYEELPSHIQEAAVRQARLVLHERYRAAEPVPLRILHTAQMREAMHVRLDGPEPTARSRAGRRAPWPGMALAGALVLVIVLIWGGIAWMRGAESTGDPTVADSASAPQTAGAIPAPGNDVTNSAGADTAQSDTQDATADVVQPGELAPSRNARSDIMQGTRVQILPGFSLTLRSEPGAAAGEAVGFLSDEQQATVVGGPRLTQGDADTIVWWLVELEDGTRAWAAANTSQTTLLVPVE